MMTREDVNKLAELVARSKFALTPTFRYELADTLAQVCASNNPHFDRERFFTACKCRDRSLTTCLDCGRAVDYSLDVTDGICDDCHDRDRTLDAQCIDGERVEPHIDL